MSTLSQFAGGGFIPSAIVNAHSTTLQDPGVSHARKSNGQFDPAKWVMSGACTAGTLKTILSVSGPGALTFLAYGNTNGSVTRTNRLKITLDGVVIFDATTVLSAKSASDVVIPVLGCIAIRDTGSSLLGGDGVTEGPPLMWSTSLLIEYATSVTETDKANIGYIYYTR